MGNIHEKDYKFSVLMSVYYKENSEWFKIALDSVINQTLKPNEIVLVEDGQLTDELYQVIDEYKTKYPNLFNIVKLEKNRGLGEALRVGVLKCSNELIARMDTDDIAKNDRFEKQVQFLKENPIVDVVGSWISEFEDSSDKIISYRQLPLSYEDIYKFGQFRCPVNHMTVMYKKSAVLKAGNYQTFKNIEDYYLWGRMLKQGTKFANIPECLVNVRAGNAMFKRRANLTYFWNSELPLHTELYKMHFISFGQYLRNICSKFLLRALPTCAMAIIYQKFLRKEHCQMFKSCTVKLKGGLGNQMFQYAFIRALSLKNNCEGLIDNSFYETDINKLSSKVAKQSLQLYNYNLQLKTTTIADNKKCLFNLPFINKVCEKKGYAGVFDINLLKKRNGNKMYIGYFQTEKYFKDYREEILKDFELKVELNEENKKMLEQIKATNSVSLHVRRGDYLNLSDIYGVCTLDYYQKAINYISSKVAEPHFYLFSDDIQWVKDNLKIDYPCTAVDINTGESGFFDLELMKNCKHNIIANSSFSWWGAWLNNNPDKIVVSPQHWVLSKKFHSDDTICEGWIKIKGER